MPNNNTNLLNNLQLRYKLSCDIAGYLNDMRFETQLNEPTKKWLCRFSHFLLFANSTIAFSQGQISASEPMIQQMADNDSITVSPALQTFFGIAGAGSTALFSANNSQQLLLSLIYHGKILTDICQTACLSRLDKTPPALSNIDSQNLLGIDDINQQINKSLSNYQRKQLKHYAKVFVSVIGVSAASVFASVAMQEENGANLLQIITAFLSSALNNTSKMTEVYDKLCNFISGCRHDSTRLYRDFFQQLQQAKQLPQQAKTQLLEQIKDDDIVLHESMFQTDPLDAFARQMTQLQILRQATNQHFGSNDDHAKPASYCKALCNNLKTPLSVLVGIGLLAAAAGGSVPYYYIKEDLKTRYSPFLTGLFTTASTTNNFVINALSALVMTTYFMTALDNLTSSHNPYKDYSIGENIALFTGFIAAFLIAGIPMLFTGLFYTFNTEENHGDKIIAYCAGGSSAVNVGTASLGLGQQIASEPTQNYIENHSQSKPQVNKDMDCQLDKMANKMTKLKTNHPVLFQHIMQQTDPNRFFKVPSSVSLAFTSDSSNTQSTSSNAATPQISPKAGDDPKTIKQSHYASLFATLCHPDTDPSEADSVLENEAENLML